jgi:predicted AlkP superfamily phosphohydrolase/phosphomutase
VKALIIGLDCAAPDMVIKNESLKNIRSLGGTEAPLLSIIPPITVPAWMCMMTGEDPGELGIYGFRNFGSQKFWDWKIANSTWVRSDTIWDEVSRTGGRNLIFAVPPSYPPKPISGIMVSGFLTPSKQRVWTYPESVAKKLDKVSGGWEFDIMNFRSDENKKGRF